MDGVESGFCPVAAVSFEEDFDPGHLLLLDYTLRRVLRGFGRCTVLAGRDTSSVSFFTSFVRSIYNFSQSSLSTQSACQTKSPGVP